MSFHEVRGGGSASARRIFGGRKLAANVPAATPAAYPSNRRRVMGNDSGLSGSCSTLPSYETGSRE